MESRFRWFTLVAMVLVAVVVGMISYNAGVSHGLAIAPAAAAAVPGAVPAYPPYMWYRPWGFGFGPVFLLLLIFFVIRPLLWGGFYRRRYWERGDVPLRFEEWHRRAHEKMNTPA